AVDTAFVDRADLKQLVPAPSAACRYEILKGSIEELCNRGLITSKETLYPFEIIQRKLQSENLENNTMSSISDRTDSNQVLEQFRLSQQLHNVATQSKNFSGRALRKLPFQAFAFFGNATTILHSVYTKENSGNDNIGTALSNNTSGLPSLSIFIDALHRAVQKEQNAQKDMKTTV
ncbi:hypothetical protein IE077_001751, partial [Cardiosporidium cionae]